MNFMIAKIWKKVLLIIVIIACLYNIVAKLATKISFDEQMQAVKDYAKSIEILKKPTDNINQNIQEMDINSQTKE